MGVMFYYYKMNLVIVRNEKLLELVSINVMKFSQGILSEAERLVQLTSLY
jgi:hypothetical protein